MPWLPMTNLTRTCPISPALQRAANGENGEHYLAMTLEKVLHLPERCCGVARNKKQPILQHEQLVPVAASRLPVEVPGSADHGEEKKKKKRRKTLISISPCFRHSLPRENTKEVAIYQADNESTIFLGDLGSGRLC